MLTTKQMIIIMFVLPVLVGIFLGVIMAKVVGV